jgi:cytochrome bd-type quinol oxidase subunit 2
MVCKVYLMADKVTVSESKLLVYTIIIVVIIIIYFIYSCRKLQLDMSNNNNITSK